MCREVTAGDPRQDGLRKQGDINPVRRRILEGRDDFSCIFLAIGDMNRR